MPICEKKFSQAIFKKSNIIALLLFQLPYIYSVTISNIELVSTLRRYFHSEVVYLFHGGGFGIKTTRSLVQQQIVLSRELCYSSVVTNLDCLTENSADEMNDQLFVLPQNDSIAAGSFLPNVANRNFSNAIWLLFLDDNDAIEKFFAATNVPFDCEFLVAQSEDDHAVLTEVYRVSPTLPLQTYRFANWTTHGGLSTTETGFYERRQNLSGLVLKTAVINNFSTKVVKTKDGKARNVTGHFAKIIELIAEDLNFTLDLYTPPDDYFGIAEENGRWNGLMGMLQRGEVEFSCINFLMTPARLEVVDFLTPIHHVRTSLVIKEERSQSIKWNEFLKPFSMKLWMVQLSIMLLIGVCFLMTYKVGRLHGREDGLDPAIYNFGDALFYTFASFCQQGQDRTPRSMSCRLVFLTSYLTAVVLLAGYSASLISYLTTKETKLPFVSFKEFLRDGTYHLGMLPHSAFTWYFSNTSDPVMFKIYKKMIEPNIAELPKTDKEGFDKACDTPNYAYLTYTPVGTYPMKCSLLAIKQIHIPGSLSMIISKNSPYKGVLNYMIHKLKRGGVLKRIAMNFTPIRRQLSPMKMDLVVYLIQLMPLFTLLGISMLAAIIFALMEKKKAEIKRRKWHN